MPVAVISALLADMNTTAPERLDDAPSLDTFKDEIHDVLSNIHGPSSFACGGTIKKVQHPDLRLRDHGPISLPLSKKHAEIIISKSKQSPFGKGSETFVDTAVRRSWQLDPSQFTVCNPLWDQTLNSILRDVYGGLLLNVRVDNVSAQLYKLLLYEEGAFFKPHKDSEKAAGMFGTLVICMPSAHKGGELVLSFNGETKTIMTSPASKTGMSYAAWYSDVLHEIKPVTSGYRLVLTYNLVLLNEEGLGMPPAPLDDKDDLIRTLTKYNEAFQDAENDFPDYLIHRLNHQYTQASLHADRLKGADLGQLQCLKEAGAELGFGIYLAHMEKEVCKTDDAYEHQWEDRCYDEDEDEDEDDEDEAVDESEEELSSDINLNYVVNLDGSRVGVPTSKGYGVRVEEDCLLDLAAYEAQSPDDEEHSGWTGNEGCTATLWYRNTVRIPFAKQR